MGIRSRLSLLSLLPAGFIGLLLAVYFTLARIADLDQTLKIRGDSLLRELATIAATPASEGNHKELELIADWALREKDVLEIGFFDSHDASLAYRLNRGNFVDRVLGGMELTAEIRPTHFPPSLSSATVSSHLGRVGLIMSRSGTFVEQCATTLLSLVLLGGGLLATLVFTRRMGRKISQPITALTFAVHEVSQGNLAVRAESQAVAELGYLQAGFNAMAAELKKNRDSLEGEVSLATQRLQVALESLEKRNRELEEARQQSEIQNQLKSKFLAQMSHEIRTPMNGIIGFAELLAKTRLNDRQQEKLGLILRSAKNLLVIINDILDLTQLEADKISLNHREFTLRPCLEDMISLLTPRTILCSVILWIAPDVPPAIHGDPIRLQQIITNLLGNALKFTQRGRIVIRVRRWQSREGMRLWFSVSDSGQGIPPMAIGRLFAPFQQLDHPVNTTERGSGLGLSISKNIVQNMGGAIHLASRPGKGSCFWFDIPLLPAEANAKPARQEPTVGLIASDRLTTQALRQQLEFLGMAIQSFESFEAFGSAETNSPKVVLYQPGAAKRPMSAWIAWLDACKAREVKPILLFPNGERRRINLYLKHGAICLYLPIHSGSLEGIITELTPGGENRQPAALLEEDSESLAPLSGRKILLADDHEINRLLLRNQLNGLQAEIVEASDGQVALEKLQTEAFDLVFLDLQMPLMNGWQVLSAMRHHPGPNQQVPTVAITAFSLPKRRLAALDSGFNAFLTKPVTEEQLWAAIEPLLADSPGEPAKRQIPEAPDPKDQFGLALLEKFGANRDYAAALVRKLAVELPENLHAAEDALQAHDRDKARDFVHKINGSSAFSDLTAIRNAAHRLEAALVEDEPWDSLKKLCGDLAWAIEGFQLSQDSILEWLADPNKHGNPPVP